MTTETTKKMSISEIIEKASAADLAAYNAGKKSFKLWNWLKDELLLQGIANNRKAKLEVTCKALSRVVNVLGRLQEDVIFQGCKVTIKDSQTVIIECKVEYEELSNIERRRLNANYNTTLNMRDEEENFDEFDVTAWH